jgi:predicted Zn-dependent protease
VRLLSRGISPSPFRGGGRGEGLTTTFALLLTFSLIAPHASAASAPGFPSTTAPPPAPSAAETERRFREVVAKRPQDPIAREELGSFLLERRRPLDAIPELHESLRLQPERFLARINLGNAIAAIGLRDEARVVFRELLRRNPGRIEVCRRLADLALETGQPEEALRIVRTGRDLDQSPEALVVLGQIYQALGKNKEARAAYEASRRLISRNPDAYYRLGRLFLASRRYTDAKQAFMAATFWDPGRADAHYYLGRAMEATGDGAGARAAFAASRKASPGYTPTSVFRPRHPPATEPELLRRADRARAAQRADLANLWTRLARAAAARHREETSLRQSVHRRPKDPAARVALARCLIRHGELGAAQSQLREAVRLRPPSSEAKSMLADLERVLAVLG